MGLMVMVGNLAGTIGVDDEGEEWLRRDFARMNEVLLENGLPQHTEPETLSGLDWRPRLVGLGYSWVHYLRRIQARLYLDPDWTPTPVDQESLEDDQSADDVVGTCNLNRHLLWHSDCEGYYLPLDFKYVLMDVDKERIPGAMLGSSVRLLAELIDLAPHLGIRLRGGKLGAKMVQELNREPAEGSPFGIERAVWFQLYEAARLSVKHGTAIRFS